MILFDFNRKAVERARRRPRNDIPLFVEDAIVARAEKLFSVGNPPDSAAQMGADVRHGDEIAPVLRQDVDGYVFVGGYPAGTALHLRFEQRRRAQRDLCNRSQRDPLFSFLT